MTTRIEELWAEQALARTNTTLQGADFHISRIDAGSTHDIYAGIDAEGYPLLAVGVHFRPRNYSLDSSALDYWRRQRKDGRWLMVLRLLRLGLEPVFGRMCQDLYDETAQLETENEVANLFQVRLDLWQQLFNRLEGGILAGNQIKGLVAELTVLQHFLSSSSRSPLEVVAAWVGPLRSDQDFVFTDLAIEVKAVSAGKGSVQISSIAQLDAPIRLVLWVISLKESSHGDTANISLNGLVTSLETTLAQMPDALSLFRDRLLRYGYIEHSAYDDCVFAITNQSTFWICENFPRLIRSNVPEGITAVSYSLRLDTLHTFSTDATPL
jgi:hypothetical protein